MAAPLKHKAVPLSELLKGFTRTRGIDESIKKASIPQVWASVVGPSAGKACKDVRMLENGVLRVTVESSVWRNEIFLRRDDLRQKMNEKLGRTMVKGIELR